jgi:hypothetical protein
MEFLCFFFFNSGKPLVNCFFGSVWGGNFRVMVGKKKKTTAEKQKNVKQRRNIVCTGNQWSGIKLVAQIYEKKKERGNYPETWYHPWFNSCLKKQSIIFISCFLPY